MQYHKQRLLKYYYNNSILTKESIVYHYVFQKGTSGKQGWFLHYLLGRRGVSLASVDIIIKCSDQTAVC